MSTEFVTDIFGDEYQVFMEQYNSVLDIKLYYGRKDGRAISPGLILTPKLKEALLKNEKRNKDSFGEHLSAWTIVRLRGKLKKNPYESLEEWASSADPHKPREVLFPSGEMQEIVEDFFGVQYVVVIARQADSGMLMLYGTPKDDAKEGEYSRRFIITSEVAELVHEHTHSDDDVLSVLPIGRRTLRKVRLELGQQYSIRHEANLWLAAHLEEIVSMNRRDFIKRYESEPLFKRPSAIRHLKLGLSRLKNLAKEQDKDARTILSLIRMHADKKSNKEAVSALDGLLSHDQVRECLKAYRILELAREQGHAIPHGYRRILKRSRT